MRGLGKMFKGAVFIAGVLGVSATAFAQADPKIAVTFDNTTVQKLQSDASYASVKLDQVTLSRTDLDTFAAYDLTITNNTTNALNRLYFTATVTNTGGTDNGTFETYYYTAPSAFSCSGFPVTDTAGNTTRYSTLSCTSNISLNPDGSYISQKVTIVVKAPTTGTKLTVNIAAGGYEGSSQTGQGCCATEKVAFTSLVDATTDATMSYTLQAITFVKSETGGRIFTGKKAVTVAADPFATDVNAAPFTSAKYDIGSIQEVAIPATSGSNCKAGNRFKICYLTAVSLPNVVYSDTTTPITPANVCARNDVLKVVMRIDSSLIKGNPTPDLTQIRVWYKADPTTTEPNPVKDQIYDCGVSNKLPCICNRYQWTNRFANGYTPDLKNDIDLLVGNDKNGALEFD
jgi:hypothetical protein